MKAGWRDTIAACTEESQGHSSLSRNGKEQNGVVVLAAKICGSKGHADRWITIAACSVALQSNAVTVFIPEPWLSLDDATIWC